MAAKCCKNETLSVVVVFIVHSGYRSLLSNLLFYKEYCFLA